MLRTFVAALTCTGAVMVITVGGGSILTLPLGLCAERLWWNMALGLIVTGRLLAWRFVKHTAELDS